MKCKVVILSAIFFVFACTAGIGQKYSQNRDGQLWIGSQLTLDMDKKVEFQIAQQLRFDQFGSSFNQSLVQVETQYRLFKFLELGAGIRTIGVKKKLNDFKRYYRWNIDASHQFKLWNISFDNRLRYQRKKEWFALEENPNFPIWDIRFRPSISYKKKKWKIKPTLAVELFWHNEYAELDGFTKNRWYVNLKYKVDKSQSISLRFIHESETKIWDADVDYILMLKYQYKLKMR